VPVAPAQRTDLARRIQERHWTVEEFTDEFNRAARRSLPGGRDHAISLGQAKRWVTGHCARPLPASRRILESMFGTDTNTLLSPSGNPVDHDPERNTPTGMARGRQSGDDEDPRPTPSEGVSPSRRRDLLSTGALLTATGIAAGPADRAARISRAMATGGPDPLTLAQLQHGIQRLTTMYAVTPHGALIDPIERAWDDAEIMLGNCRPGTTRRDLELVAGQYAYYRGQLAFDMGDDHTALTFFVLAAQHAASAADLLLSGSVAVMRSAVAFFAGDFGQAATVARAAQPDAHPYAAPILAGCLARALAQTGDAAGSMAALHAMNDSVWDRGPLPGPNPGDAEFCEAFGAATFTYLGRGTEAEQHARRSLTLLDGTGRHVQIAGTHLALARAYLRRERPDPERAAQAIRDALTAADGNDHGATMTRAAGIYRRLTTTRDWARLPAIRDLGDRLPTPRALPPGAAV